MRHRLGNAKLQRDTAHRVLMLRNLVSSLVEHDQVTTTLAKAKQAQRLADKLVSLAKKGDKVGANAFLLNQQETLARLFDVLAPRYQARAGGYTRVTRAGFRQGDHAPRAILEFVSSPKDSKVELTARTLARSLALEARKRQDPKTWQAFVDQLTKSEILAKLGVTSPTASSSSSKASAERLSSKDASQVGVDLRTLRDVRKALLYRSEGDDAATHAPTTSEASRVPASVGDFLARVREHYLRTLATLSSRTSPVRDGDVRLRETTKRLERSFASSSEVDPETGAPVLRPTFHKLKGRWPRAGEDSTGWNLDTADQLRLGSFGAAARNHTYKPGGPLSRAKFFHR